LLVEKSQDANQDRSALLFSLNKPAVPHYSKEFLSSCTVEQGDRDHLSLGESVQGVSSMKHELREI
jgi:hypothetical protein